MFRIVLRSLWYYRRTHAVVVLAVLISTAVIGGALVVGDSVRFSLQTMTQQRLGHLTHALTGARFFREGLADELQNSAGLKDKSLQIAPAMLLTGSIEKTTADNSKRRAGSVILLGVTPQSWPMLLTGGASMPGSSGIVLGARTAQELNAAKGDQVSVWIERPSSIPRDTLLGEREDVNLEIVLTVDAILSESDGASRFSLNPGQQLPYNAFVSLTTLQERLGLEAAEASRRNPIARPARINTILAGNMPDSNAGETSNPAAQIMADLATNTLLMSALKDQIRLDDIGLRIRPVEGQGYVSVESDSMIIEDSAAEAVQKAVETIGMQSSPTLVYLANEIRAAESSDSKTRYSMYSIVAGLSFDRKSPLGPFVLRDGSPVPPLNDNEIILSDWLMKDLQVSEGDLVEARWHEVGSHGDLPETRRRFTVRGILKADDPVSVDRDLTPFVDGVTNVDSFGDWDQPFEMEMERITDRDDEYWSEHRAAPKAFVSLATAEKYWSSRFGSSTSIRVGAQNQKLSAEQLEVLRQRLDQQTRQGLQPARLGLYFRPVLAEGLQASVGANNFSGLFIGFSFFLIVSAVLLASLMFRLGIQQRVSQAGLLEAIGFTKSGARTFFLTEGIVVAIVGVIAGSFTAVWFAQFMIYGLTKWWVGAVGTQFLLLHVRPAMLVAAAAGSLLLIVVVIWLALRGSTQRAPRELLMGSSVEDEEIGANAAGWYQTLMNIFLLVSVLVAAGLPALLVADQIPSNEAFAGMSWRVVCFMIAGIAWLSAGLLWLRRQLQRRSGTTVRGNNLHNLSSLAMANAARSARRSLMTTALIAFATFVIVVVGTARRNPVSEIPDIRSGNGGFALVAESSQPVLYNPDTPEGRQKLGLDRTPQTTLPNGTRIFGFGMRPGQDASCLNLYQTTLPTLLGASPEFLKRGGFRFADTKFEKPWEELTSPLPDRDGVPVIPVIGDLNTLQYSLKKGIGEVIHFPSESAPEFALQIIGMLDSSIFQGVLVMSDENLKRIAPETSGARYFLAEIPGGAKARDQAAMVLETTLNAFGIDSEPVSQRLAGFLAVQNTYLSTFQMLGGLGLLVGTFGLAAVMMRNVIERRSEIALLKALGFTTRRVVGLILLENSVLLLWGVVTGTAAALIGMVPHLLSTGADVNWLQLGGTLIIVCLAGTMAAAFPIRAAIRTNIREGLAAG